MDDGLVVALLGLQFDDRLQGLSMQRIDLQRLFEHVERALSLAELLPHHAEPVIDTHDRSAFFQGVLVLDQNGLVDAAGVVPALHLVEQIGAADQGRQVGRVDVVRRLVELQRLLEIVQLVGAARGPVVEIVEIARVALFLLGLAHQHIEDG